MSIHDYRSAVLHECNYKLMATRLPDGRIGFERFTAANPIYMFGCKCGDVIKAPLDKAAEEGWIAVLDSTSHE